MLTSLQFVAPIPMDRPLADEAVVEATNLHQQDFVSPSVLDHSREEIESCLRSAGAVPNERCQCSPPPVALQMVESGIGLVDHLQEIRIFSPPRPGLAGANAATRRKPGR